jgi:hypothetical protein
MIGWRGDDARAVSRRTSPRWMWPAVAFLAACVPFVHGFSLTKIFYVRDLTMFFWPRHLWIRSWLLAGDWPMWDPYAAAGQATFPDALNQMFLPPVLLLRTLFPAVVGFNLIVITPFPLAAIGAWLFFRRRVSGGAATLGAVVFAASGAVISTSNFPNLSWSTAWMPWILWAVDRDQWAPSSRSLSLVAVLIALQMLSGEPVTMMGTMALVVAYVLSGAGHSGSTGTRIRALARVVGAMAAAGVISAVQLVPMTLAAQESQRGLLKANYFWSLHPLWLLESVLPHVFGHSYFGYNQQMPWLRPLNSGRDPFFYSLYVGPVVLLLSMLGALAGPRRWRLFWLAVVVVAVVCSFGDYTPVYPALQQIVPAVRSFRFPVKFFLFASLGLAALVANAAEGLQLPAISRDSTRTARWAVRVMIGTGLAAAAALVTLIGLVLVVPFTGARAFHALGVMLDLDDPVAGAAFLFDSVPPVATRVLFLLFASALLAYLGWAARREAKVARPLLYGLAMIELLAVNADLNPVLPASQLGAPSWIAAIRAHPADRFYFGGKFRGTLIESDIDMPRVQWRAPHGFSVEEGRAVMVAGLVMTPAAWGVRELMSYDLPLLWPIERAYAEARFEKAERSERLRFLSRGGVRYCLLGSPPQPDMAPVQPVGEDFGGMGVYECAPDTRRAYVVTAASVVPDVKTQLSWLFDESFEAESTVMLERPAPAAAGEMGTPVPAFARISYDAAHEVVVDASAGAEGGYLVLLDSYDPYWEVEVDGRAAPLLRANALFRAVHLVPGRHTIKFVYRPTSLYVSAAVSGLAAIALGLLALRRPRKERDVVRVGATEARGERAPEMAANALH